MTQVTDLYKQLGNVDDVAEQLRLPRAEVVAEVTAMPDRELYRRRGSMQKYTRDELKILLRTASNLHSVNKKPLTVPAYRKLAPEHGLPSDSLYIREFGSFTKACAEAGVLHNAPKGGDRTRFTAEACYPFIRECAVDLKRRPSFDLYDDWAKTKTGAPSGATVRSKHGGKWSPAVRKAFESD